jgi:hypothetical protein
MNDTIDKLMRSELTAVLDAGYTLELGYTDEAQKEFCFYLHASNMDRKKSVYGHMKTNDLTDREIAFAASYFLLGTLEGRGKINMEKVTA